MNKPIKATPMHARVLRGQKPAPKPQPPVQPTNRLAKLLAENGEK